MRNGNPRFYELLEEMAKTHDIKSHDYASDENPSGNYHFAGSLAKLFNDHHDAGFVGRIGEKIYRLANLENSGKNPSNESIEDTERDIAVITCLWMTDRRDRRNKPNPLETELFDLIKLMPDSQTQKIVDFILEMRAIRKQDAYQGTYDVGERYPGPPNAMGCDEIGVKKAATDRPNQGKPAALSIEAEEVLRMILMTNNRILHMLSK